MTVVTSDTVRFLPNIPIFRHPLFPAGHCDSDRVLDDFLAGSEVFGQQGHHSVSVLLGVDLSEFRGQLGPPYRLLRHLVGVLLRHLLLHSLCHPPATLASVFAAISQ